MSQEQMTDAEYRECKGLNCPYCRSTEIEGGSVTVENGQAFQDISCNECDEEWTDSYDLKGWSQQ